MLIILFYVLWMFQFSLKKEKKHSILTFQRNLFTLRHQTALEICLLVYLFLDQMNTKFCEVFFPSLGPKVTFQVWWSIHFLEKILILFVKNLAILHISITEYPELYGYVGQSFPDQQGPRSPSRKHIILNGKIKTRKYFILDVVPARIVGTNTRVQKNCCVKIQVLPSIKVVKYK